MNASAPFLHFNYAFMHNQLPQPQFTSYIPFQDIGLLGDSSSIIDHSPMKKLKSNGGDTNLLSRPNQTLLPTGILEASENIEIRLPAKKRTKTGAKNSRKMTKSSKKTKKTNDKRPHPDADAHTEDRTPTEASNSPGFATDMSFSTNVNQFPLNTTMGDLIRGSPMDIDASTCYWGSLGILPMAEQMVHKDVLRDYLEKEDKEFKLFMKKIDDIIAVCRGEPTSTD